MRRSLAMILFLAWAVSPNTSLAQTSTGTLQGVVKDASGAVISAAQVTITNEATGVKNELATNDEGRYVAPLLLPGSYQVAVEKQDFRKFTRGGVRLSVQQNLSVDVELTVGDVTTTVNVTGAAPSLETNTSTVATVIENKRIVDLPLNGRNPFALALLTPGVIAGGGSSSTPWISGGRNASSEVTIDGTSITMPDNNVGLNQLAYTPSVDAVAEFTVLTNSLAAEYGRTGGGVINVATKQGTNALHGSAFEFLRNSQLDANGFFRNRNRVPRGAFQRNQFGGTLGGPILMPKEIFGPLAYDGRNRSFFFFDYQGTRTRSASEFTGTMPLEEWKRGDFSNLRNAAGQLIRIYDPLTTRPDGQGNFIRDPFPNNIIPASRIDPVARNLMKFFPSPNATPVNQFTQVNNYFVAGKSKSNDDRWDIRLDHNLSARWRMFGRYSRAHNTSDPVNFYGNLATAAGSGPTETTNHSFSMDHTITINPTTLVSLRYGFGRFVSDNAPFSRGFDLTTLGFPASLQAEAAKTVPQFPRIDILGLSSLGQPTFTSLHYVPNSHVVHADFTKVLSRHTIKTGMQYKKLMLNFLQLGQPSGQYSFDARWTQRDPVRASSTEGFGLASLLIGVPTGGTISHEPTPAQASSYWGLYVQDDWRMSQNLTLNLGLRYELDVPRTERFNRLSYFDLDAPSPIAGKVPGFPNLTGAFRFADENNRRQAPADRNNFGPRFGFAWQFLPKTVARGAYALMYSGSAMQAASHTGTSGMEGFNSLTSVISSLDGRTPIAFLSNPFPNGFNLPLGAAAGPLSGPSTQLGLSISEGFFIDTRNPVIQQWNLNLQRELPGSVVVEAGYLGSKGNHLIDGGGQLTYNQLPASFFSLGNALNDLVPNPFFGVITNPTSPLSRPTVTRAQLLRPYPQYTSLNAFRKPGANSIYHAFTLRVEKRYSQGLSLLLAYTGGKLIDDASNAVTFLGQAALKQNFYNRRAERSISTQDVSSRLVISFNYDLPLGHGRKFLAGAPRVVDWVLGGWQVNGIVTFQTGTPVVLTQAQNNTGLGTSSQRPNNNGKSAKITGGTKDERIQRWFDPSVFSIAPPFTFGNVSRTLPDVRNPGQRNFDLSLFKNFRASQDKLNFQLRAEAFNALNTTQFAAPGATVGTPNIGVISATAVAPRQIQLALKILF